MPPSIAALAWFVLLIALLRFDPARDRKASLVLWLPVIWLFFAASRLPSQWLDLAGGVTISAQAQEEGNSTDRFVYTGLIVLSVAVLASRSFRWSGFLRANPALTAFLGYCLVSFIWSDFPLIALKRWFRDLGDYLLLLVILSDMRPVIAVRTVLRRLSFLLIPLSLLLIKYYPQLAIHYDFWNGAPEYVGAATSKNTLGSMCLVSGLVFFWDTLICWPSRKERNSRRIIILNAVMFLMTLWVLHLSNSATSHVCLAMGCLVILVAQTKWSKRNPRFLKVLMPGAFLLYLFVDFGLGMNGEIAGGLGRNPNLTGRTEIWHTLLSVHINPLLGTGYETFWMGPRQAWIWEQRGHINEAHNGYLDLYLNLGYAGLFLLVMVLISSYRHACSGLDRRSELASLGAATWTLLLFYSMSEAAFKNGLLWMTLLLGTMVVPRALKPRSNTVSTAPVSSEPWSEPKRKVAI